MSKVIFRNCDKRAIRQLLKEIGHDRYYAALDDAGLSKQKPIGMDGFYVEFEVDTQTPWLCYRYPSGVTFRLMDVLGYWGVPSDGWDMRREGDR